MAPKGGVCWARMRTSNGANMGESTERRRRVGCHQCSLMRFEGSCVKLKWPQVLVAAGHNKPDTWIKVVVRRSREDISLCVLYIAMYLNI